MVVLGLLGVVLFLALVFGPRAWIGAVMARHGQARSDFPGTGAELARHLLDQAGLQHVKIDRIVGGDHYSPKDKAVRLSPSNFDGKSITAVAVAAHEVGHALQDAQGYRPLHLRQKLVGYTIVFQNVGSVLLLTMPIVLLVVRSPALLLVQLLAALTILMSNVVIHAVTLPTEFDASFKRALPALEQHLPADDMPGARSVLKAAAFTYVAAALVTLLDISRWLRILRF